MKICFLDSYTNIHGDLSFDKFHQLGDFTAYDRTDPDQLDRLNLIDTEIIIVNKFPVDEKTIQWMPAVKYICVAATGYNNIDLKVTNNHQIQVSNVKNYAIHSVAQHVFAALLDYCNKTQYYNNQVKKGRWSKSEDFCFYDHTIDELFGKTIGIIGFGSIGKQVATIALAFGMKVIIYNKSKIKQISTGIIQVDKKYLFENSDVITLHCPLNSATANMINAESISWMQPHTILINTGRGGLINEMDLLDALDKSLIKCAILDVLQIEPPHQNHPLIQHDKCFITPHIAWAGIQARERLLDGVVHNIKSWLQGDWVNRVESKI